MEFEAHIKLRKFWRLRVTLPKKRKRSLLVHLSATERLHSAIHVLLKRSQSSIVLPKQRLKKKRDRNFWMKPKSRRKILETLLVGWLHNMAWIL